MNSPITATNHESDELTYSVQVSDAASFEMSISAVASGGKQITKPTRTVSGKFLILSSLVGPTGFEPVTCRL